ncbi:hypothetical protein M3Y97_00943500 [Aphelenchoides bicaudatus]|nr:hypothetical protein M3Y97_00943500 [Aphelenchoides bicaudatus]
MIVKSLLICLIIFIGTVQSANRRDPKLKPVKCEKVIAFFDGTFHNKIQPMVNSWAQFQLQLHANQTDRLVYAHINKWNQTVSKSRDFEFGFHDKFCKVGQVCTTRFDNFYGLYLATKNGLNSKRNNNYQFLYFNDFENSFQLEYPVNGCTKVKAIKHPGEFATDDGYLQFCLCCGEKYKTDSSLDCPRNHWY